VEEGGSEADSSEMSEGRPVRCRVEEEGEWTDTASEQNIVPCALLLDSCSTRLGRPRLSHTLAMDDRHETGRPRGSCDCVLGIRISDGRPCLVPCSGSVVGR